MDDDTQPTVFGIDRKAPSIDPIVMMLAEIKLQGKQTHEQVSATRTELKELDGRVRHIDTEMLGFNYRLSRLEEMKIETHFDTVDARIDHPDPTLHLTGGEISFVRFVRSMFGKWGAVALAICASVLAGLILGHVGHIF